MLPDFSIEEQFENKIVLAIDEAGRGPLAGPVVAACVLLDKSNVVEGINDSKKIPKNKRLSIYQELKTKVKYGVGVVDEKIIDQINILQATKLAMLRSYQDFYQKYNLKAEVILVDGNFSPFNSASNYFFENYFADEYHSIFVVNKSLAIIKGDQKSLSIATASIIAKEYRDQIMWQYHQQYPQFDFHKNSGYGTKKHLASINEIGVLPIHRRSFEPIKSMIKSNANN